MQFLCGSHNVSELRKDCRLCATLSALFFVISCRAEINTDASWGRTPTDIPKVGAEYKIPAELGKQAGSNLFHSFSVFNLETVGGVPEKATFTGPNSVTNILARVTGGNPSNINGTICTQFENANPNLFFINPAGVIFGKNANLDIKGSFHVSTANAIRMQGDGKYNAYPSLSDNVLSVTSPESFGFLDKKNGSISVDGSLNLRLEGNNLLELHANKITVTNKADVVASRIKIFSSELLLLNGSSLRAGSSLDNTPGSKFIAIETDTLKLHGGARISATNFGFRQKLRNSIDITARDEIKLLDRSSISSVAVGDGNGGAINLRGTRISLDNAATITTRTEGSKSTGDAGYITIDCGSLTFQNGSQVSSSSNGSGKAGVITINAKNTIDLRNNSSISVETKTSDAGSIYLTANNFVKLDNSQITTSVANGGGNGGNIDISRSTTFFILNNGSKLIANARKGDAGKINIQSDYLFRSPDSIIKASSEFGKQGRITIKSPESNITNSLLTLVDAFFDASSYLKHGCKVNNRQRNSSLRVFAKSTLYLPDTYIFSHTKNSY